MSAPTIKVALCDDHRMLRDALAGILATEPDIEVIGAASDGEALLTLVRARAPDVLVLDISMPGMSGIEVAQRLREMNSPAKILALSAYSDRGFVQEMLRAGAAGYITKDGAATELTQAIRQVAAGKTYLSPSITSVLANAAVDDARNPLPAASLLSVREQQVLGYIAGGMRSADIAERLDIALATVDVHRRNIMRKLDMHTVAELTRYAVREGMVRL
jgi:DNA-binding NarL/FixJ family response regulator